MSRRYRVAASGPRAARGLGLLPGVGGLNLLALVGYGVVGWYALKWGKRKVEALKTRAAQLPSNQAGELPPDMR